MRQFILTGLLGVLMLGGISNISSADIFTDEWH